MISGFGMHSRHESTLEIFLGTEMKLTNLPLFFPWQRISTRLLTALLFAMLFLGNCPFSSGQVSDEANQQATPTKQALIETLKAFLPLLENKDFEKASKSCALPPDFKPEMLDGMIERQEISLAGIELLEKEAKFGKAAELFGTDRGSTYAKQALVDLDSCYGFFHTANSETAEVIAYWNGTEFKLIRLDDVGKIAGTANAAKVPIPLPEDAAKRLPELQAAVEANPNDVTALNSYAMALYQAGKLSESWAQLLKAYQLQPYHGGVVRGLETCFAEFEKRGVFAANTTRENLEAVLGKPERTVDMLLLKRERLVYAFVAVDLVSSRVYEVIDTRGATNVLFEPKEELIVDLHGQGLFCGYRKKSKASSLSKYYPAKQSMTEWNESVEVERILGAATVGSPAQIVEIMMDQIKQQHPDATHNILADDDKSIVVGVVIPARPEFKFEKRYQLIRLLKGTDDVYRLAYTLKSDQLPAETETKWLELMKSATLKPARQKLVK